MKCAMFLAMSVLFCRMGIAQVYFNQQLDVSHHYEYLYDVVRLKGSGDLLLAGGEGTIFGIYVNNFLLAKYNEQGDLIWDKPFNLGSNQFGPMYGNAANMVKIDEDYSLVEGTLSILVNDSTYNTQQCFIKISNVTGDTVWVKKHGELDWEDSSGRMIKTGDSGFVVVGWTFKGTGRSSVSLIKIDSAGNKVFRKTYTTDDSKNHFGWSLTETSDGGFLLLCFNKYIGPCNGCVFNDQIRETILIKTDASGNQQWTKTFPVWEWREIANPGEDLVELPNGNFLIIGFKEYYPGNEPSFTFYSKYNFWIISPTGELVDSVSYGKHFNAIAYRIVPVSDGNFLVAGHEIDTPSVNGQTGLLLKVNSSGQPLWKREYRVSPPESKIHDAFFDAVEMPDKGFVLCGRAYGPLEDSTNQNAWLIRVDSLGCLEPGCDTVFTAVHDPPQEGDIGILLSPNPTGGEVRLALTDPEAVLLGVRLLDIQGRVIEDVQFLRGAGWRECDLNLAGQAAGVYMVQVRMSEGWVVRKVVKR